MYYTTIIIVDMVYEIMQGFLAIKDCSMILSVKVLVKAARGFLMGRWYQPLASSEGSESWAPVVEVVYTGVIKGM